MRLTWISVIAASAALVALAGVVILGFAYENLRRQMAGISSDMARLPSPSASHEHYEARLAVIRSQLSSVEKPIIVMGDSIVEAAILPLALCGRPIINAGIGGATIGFFTRYAEIITRNSDPELVVLSVGVNDAGADPAVFRAAYLAVLHSIRAPVVLASITPTRDYDVDRLNKVIKSLGGYSIIDFTELKPDMTTDGIHLSQAGYKLWTAALVQAIETNLGCSK